MLIPVTSSNQPESSRPGPSGPQSGDTASLKRNRLPDAKKSRQEDSEASAEAAAEASSLMFL